MIPLFDIFSGHFLRKDAVWIEACGGSADAVRRMLEMAAKKPGPYFMFSCHSRRCVVSVDTSSSAQNDKTDLAVALSGYAGPSSFIN